MNEYGDELWETYRGFFFFLRNYGGCQDKKKKQDKNLKDE